MLLKTPSPITVEGCTIWLFHNSEAGQEGFLGALTNHHPLIRSPRIISEERRNALIMLAENMMKHIGSYPLRVSCLQLDELSSDWNFIQQQHRTIITNDCLTAHLCFPTRPLYFKYDAASQAEFLQKALKKLQNQFNAQAWQIYCQWMAEEINPILAAFQPEDSEEYQLQARLEDFIHEVYSGLMNDLKVEIAALLDDQEDAFLKKNQEFLRTVETHLAECRERLVRLMQMQANLLLDIYEGIGKIEDLHAELIPLKQKAFILHKLMADQLELSGEKLSWGQQLLLLQWLDQKLHVVSAVNDELSKERIPLVFAIRLALAELSKDHSEEKILELCLKWGTSNAHDESYLKLCERVWASYEALAFSHKQELNKNLSDEKEEVNQDLLLFLPKTISIQTDNKEIRVALLSLDSNGKPYACTPTGKRLFHHLQSGRRLKLQ
jgi:hypothetical protein